MEGPRKQRKFVFGPNKKFEKKRAKKLISNTLGQENNFLIKNQLEM
jgi:hypothetical protein